MADRPVIFDAPFISDLAVGSDRVIPTEGDAQLFMPPVLQPVVEPLRSHVVSNLSTDIANVSRISERQNTYLNQAATSDALITLPKGLYELEISISAHANFTTLVLGNSVTIDLVYQGFTITLFALKLAANNPQNFNFTRRLLLITEGLLEVRVPSTNAVATNSIAYEIGLNVIRIL